jgi:hypothetical protein
MPNVMQEFRPLKYQVAKDIATNPFWYSKVYEDFDSVQAVESGVEIHQVKWSLKKNSHNGFDASLEITIVCQVQCKILRRYQLNHFKVYRIDLMHLQLRQTE